MILRGIDEAWAKLDPETAAAQGFDFIIGYVSEDETKNLTSADIVRIHAAGLAVAFVYEFNPSSALGGYPTGVANGQVALAHFQSLGVPTGVACYNAGTDFNVQPGQMSTCLSHETGFSDVLRPHGYRVGGYTGYPFASYLAQHNYGGFIWQTYAWSNGAWLASAALRQTANGVHIAGVDVDIDESEVIDFGQWSSDMAITDADFQALIWRVKSLLDMNDTVEAGPNQGDDIKLVASIKALMAAQVQPSTVLSDADRALLQSFVDSVNTVVAHLK